MSELFNNRYRSDTARLKTWNYGSEGMYFVTVCTAGRVCYFGDVEFNKMNLTAVGKLLNQNGTIPSNCAQI